MSMSRALPAGRLATRAAFPTCTRPLAGRSGLSLKASPMRTSTQAQVRTFLRGQDSHSGRARETLNVDRMRSESYHYHVTRRNFLLSGVVAGVLAFSYTAYLLSVELRKPKRLDARPSPAGQPDPFSTEAGTQRKTVIHDAQGRELVPTGDSTVPLFPRTLDLPPGLGAAHQHGRETIDGVEYTLVGLGKRTVSFLGIRVYLVGYYIATQDVAAIQKRLTREINPIATTLVPGEKDELRAALLDPERGERLWSDVLTEVSPRSLFRIVPVRDTDFHHLRDGFVRAIQARSAHPAADPAFKDQSFGDAVQEFKALFNRGKLPTNRELLLCRDAAGRLTITYEQQEHKAKAAPAADTASLATLGHVADERISRLLWLNYLAGKNVASEPARQNIVSGIMEFVERPIGTVATQVL